MISRGVRWQLMKGKQCWWINQWFNWSMHKWSALTHFKSAEIILMIFSCAENLCTASWETTVITGFLRSWTVGSLRDLLYSSVSPVTPIFTDTPPWMHVGLSIKIADCVAKNTQKTTVLSHHCCQDTHTYFLLSAETKRCDIPVGSIWGHHICLAIYLSLSLSPYVYMCVCMCVCVCKWPQTQLQKTLIKKNR